MTNEELEIRFERLVKTERKITLEILHLIREAERRRHFLERGFGSIYDWLIRGHGYSQSAANRRIQSSRLLEIPDAGEKIISGAVNITTLTQLQTVIRHEERRTGETIPAERKETLVNQISGKSAQEVERILKPIFPETPKKEVMKITSADNARLSINLDREGWEALERVRELLACGPLRHLVRNRGLPRAGISKAQRPLIEKVRSGKPPRQKAGRGKM